MTFGPRSLRPLQRRGARAGAGAQFADQQPVEEPGVTEFEPRGLLVPAARVLV